MALRPCGNFRFLYFTERGSEPCSTGCSDNKRRPGRSRRGRKPVEDISVDVGRLAIIGWIRHRQFHVIVELQQRLKEMVSACDKQGASLSLYRKVGKRDIIQ